MPNKTWLAYSTPVLSLCVLFLGKTLLSQSCSSFLTISTYFILKYFLLAEVFVKIQLFQRRLKHRWENNPDYFDRRQSLKKFRAKAYREKYLLIIFINWECHLSKQSDFFSVCSFVLRMALSYNLF